MLCLLASGWNWMTEDGQAAEVVNDLFLEVQDDDDWQTQKASL